MEKDSVLISMQAIQKSFGGVQALKNGQLELRKGEVLGLIGENGAGKSTLMKILSGVYTADAGEIYVEGKNSLNGTLITKYNPTRRVRQQSPSMDTP